MHKNILQKILYYAILIIVVIHPLIELDYLAAQYFDAINLPRLTTVVDFVILPLLVIAIFALYEKNKRKVAFIFGIYLLFFGAYFIVHVLQADELQYALFLPDNYIFLLSDEIFYTITLLLPLVYIWADDRLEVSASALEKTISGSSIVMAWPIVVTDLLNVGMSTYVGMTKANFLSWFALPYDRYNRQPRMYTCKFFFDEGNTIGIALFIILPLLYYFLYKYRKENKKYFFLFLIIIQSLAMLILGTRIATFGALLVPIGMMVAYGILALLKKEEWHWQFILVSAIVALAVGFIIPYSPAYQQQLIGDRDYTFLKEDNDRFAKAEAIRREGENLVKYSEEWRDFYVYMFEDYAFLMNVTPPIYYREWYDYHHDPEFWVDLIFDYSLADRADGRQIQNIFTHYKWDMLSPQQKLFGMGYGTFMRGSILLERDFAQQYFSYGPLGFVFLMVPWILAALYLIFKTIIGYKKGRWNLMNIALLMAMACGFVGAYMSGHTLDELTTSLIMALIMGYMFKEYRINHE